jgi:glycosyltransferase XagB
MKLQIVFICLVLLLFPAFRHVSAVEPTLTIGENALLYTIQPGDTLWDIARTNATTVETLLAVNDSLNPYALTIGQTVIIPTVNTDLSPTTTPTAPLTPIEYLVQPDDTVWDIAHAHNTTVEAIVALNPGLNPRVISIGQVLFMPNPDAVTMLPDAAVSIDETLPQLMLEVPLIQPEENDSILLLTDEQISTSLPHIPPSVNLFDLIERPEIGPIQNESPLIPLLEPTDSTETVEEPAPEVFASTLIPITIAIPEDYDLAVAELSVNGYSLAVFYEPPYTHDLDLEMFDVGLYTLNFTAQSALGVVSAASLDFEVAAMPVDAATPMGAAADLINTVAVETQPRILSETGLPRVLLVDNQVQPLDLVFSPEQGLAFAKPPSTAMLPGEEETLMSILTSPLDLIPAPILEGLTMQRPELFSIVALMMTLTLLPQGLFTLYWMLYTWNNPLVAALYRAPKTFSEPQYSFTAILPARHEEDVIKDTIRAVDRIAYPDHLKEILVMIRDEDDDQTIANAREVVAELGKENIRVITFKDGPKNKPNGLNKALRVATRDVVCVFDAEDEPHPELYHVINSVMIRDNADVVQAGVQLMNFRSTWFSALNCLEYFFWFKSGLHCFTRQFKVTPLGGNTVFFKRHWLEKVGGWDEGCLTEDGDIGLRLTQLGAKIQIVYNEEHATREETPATVDSFIKQRTRWNQGFYQIFFKGDWLRMPEMRQRVTALYILLNSLLQAALVLYLPLGLYIGLTQRLPVPVALFSWVPIYMLLIQLVINLIGIREFTKAYSLRLPLLFRLKMTIVYYPYQLLLAVAAARAIWRMVTNRQSWEKTAHANLHRQAVTGGA